MPEKAVSKHLSNLEKQFAMTDPVLQKAVKVFHELDQLEYELGLIHDDDTTARKIAWWPVMSVMGGYSPAKSEFLSRYLGTHLHTTRHKFTIHQYTPQPAITTLPATALDADHRLPFYQVSRDIEQLAKGEGDKINAYLELVTVNSDKLRGKLIIDMPVLSQVSEHPVNALLRKRAIDLSDLVLVFTDLFEADTQLASDSIANIKQYQDSNKFVFVIDHSEINLDALKITEITSSWQRRLAELGINTGQFIVLSAASDMTAIDHRINQLNQARSYRVLQSLEKSIRDIDDVVIAEVEVAIDAWKERANASTLIILGFVITLILFAEISIGVIQFFFDPIVGPILILGLVAIITPLHLIISKLHSKFIIADLVQRQKKLNLLEDLSGLFELNLSFWRTLLPVRDSIAKGKKIRNRLNNLIEQTKNLVQSLNDQFSHYQADSYGATFYHPQENDRHTSF